MSTSETEFSLERSMKKVESYPFLHRFLPVDRFIIRPPASLVAKALYRTDVTPNQVTKASLVVALLAGMVYAGGRPLFFALAGILVLISAILDAADGMLARAKAMTSRYGAYLDLFLDRIADFLVLAGAAYGYFKYTRSLTFLAFGFGTIGLYFLQLGLYYINQLYSRTEKKGEGAEAKSLAAFLIFIFSVLGRPNLALVAVFGVALPGTVIKLVRFLAKGRDPEAVRIL
jgi:phosphatidylglycerophosphate synthase